MFIKQRHDIILDLLHTNGAVHTAELTGQLHTSYETIRKDLELLESNGQLTRVHGGAILREKQETPAPVSDHYVNFDDREIQNVDRKTAVAERAAEFIQEGQSVALDAGTSSLILARTIKNRFHRLTVFTSSVKVALELVTHPGFTVICTGGVLMADEYSFVSDFALHVFEKCNIDIAFLTASGITPENGITDQRLEEIRVQDKIREASAQVVVVADSSKIGKVSMVRICGLEDVDVIITDSGVNADLAERIAQRTKRFIVV